MEENINERLSELGTKILATTRNELYIHMRFLDVALSSFAYVIDPSVNGVGTDGMQQSGNEQSLSAYGLALYSSSYNKKKRKGQNIVEYFLRYCSGIHY